MGAGLWKSQIDRAGPYDVALFDTWLGAGEANALAWGRLDRAWSMFEDTDATEFFALRLEALSIASSARLREQTRGWSRGWQRMAAACLLFALPGGVVLFMPQHHGEPERGRILARSSAVSSGETRYAARDRDETLVLADGSRIVAPRQLGTCRF